MIEFWWLILELWFISGYLLFLVHWNSKWDIRASDLVMALVMALVMSVLGLIWLFVILVVILVDNLPDGVIIKSRDFRRHSKE